MRVNLKDYYILQKSIITIWAISLTACSNRHPVYSDYDYAIPMIVRPADSLLVGEYELDEFSYSLVDETKAYRNTPILLTLQANGSFQLTNLPDMAISSAGNPVNGQLLNAIGAWSVPADTASSSNSFIPFLRMIIFRFKADDSSPSPITMSNELKLRDKQPAIWIPLGSHKKLLFVKKE